MQANGKAEERADVYEELWDRDMTEEELAEGRSRLAAGLKRYFHGKRLEGLLSNQVGLCRILWFLLFPDVYCTIRYFILQCCK